MEFLGLILVPEVINEGDSYYDLYSHQIRVADRMTFSGDMCRKIKHAKV